jgi:hypothetical protein
MGVRVRMNRVGIVKTMNPHSHLLRFFHFDYFTQEQGRGIQQKVEEFRGDRESNHK